MLKPNYGRGPFKYKWYSICSQHRKGVEGCDRCAGGVYVNVWKDHVESTIYMLVPWLWRWWVNRRLR